MTDKENPWGNANVRLAINAYQGRVMGHHFEHDPLMTRDAARKLVAEAIGLCQDRRAGDVLGGQEASHEVLAAGIAALDIRFTVTIEQMRAAFNAMRAALAVQVQPVAEPVGDTGNGEADALINRLMSSDPDFDDCTDAAAFIRRLVIENKGPDGFATWRDAAFAERMRRVKAEFAIAAPVAAAQPVAHIDAQRAPVAAGVQQGWISVADRLPEIDMNTPEWRRRVKVLAAWGSEPGMVSEMSYSSNGYAKTEKGRSPRFEWQGKLSPWEVTHWMPMPPAPARAPAAPTTGQEG